MKKQVSELPKKDTSYENMNQSIFNNVKQSKNCYSYDHDKARSFFDKQASSRSKILDLEEYEIM